jgi:NAD(P)-dependent dehydrogenase (short-subunit alcohol dehydrogenase family)
MLAVTGYNSRIVQELTPLLPEGEEVVGIEHRAETVNLPASNRYLFCAGIIRPKRLTEQDHQEVGETFTVNCLRPMQFCDAILDRIDNARICVIGSESGFSWSYDGAYAAAKAALHRYVETKKLKPGQQLVCVAPSIIEDAGMTLRRTDHENLARRREESPKKRFLRAAEVAKLVHFLLYVDEGYLSGQVIRMNGGV